MEQFSISLDAPPSEANINTLIQHLVSFNQRHVGKLNWQKFAFFIQDDRGEILGGLSGETFWGWLFIAHIWVTESLRGKGYGRELMKRAEQEAVNRGCQHAYLDTYDFQALGFYQKVGYQVFGVLEDFPEGHTRYFLQKRNLTLNSNLKVR